MDEQLHVINYLREENRVVRDQLKLCHFLPRSSGNRGTGRNFKDALLCRSRNRRVRPIRRRVMSISEGGSFPLLVPNLS
jgi:hypothetical protein